MSDRPRNPFRNEADAFRVLVMFVLAGAAVVAAAALIDPAVGLALAGVFCAIGCGRAWGLWQDWGEG